MPLEILGPVVLAGIVIVVMMVWLIANHPPRLLISPETAESSFLADYPDVTVGGEWSIDDDKRNAVCKLSDPSGALALVEVLGSKHVTRLLFAEDIRKVKETGEGVTIRLTDFTLPIVEFASRDTGKRSAILQILDSVETAEKRVKPGL